MFTVASTYDLAHYTSESGKEVHEDNGSDSDCRPEHRASSAECDPQHELTVLATVAHELRGPLTALATSSELLAEDFLQLDPEQVRTCWRRCIAARCGSRASSRTCCAPPRSAKVACTCTASRSRSPTCWAMCKLWSSRCSLSADSELRVRVTPRLPEVLADSRRLGQVLVNLILNASKFGAAELRHRDRRDPQG